MTNPNKPLPEIYRNFKLEDDGTLILNMGPQHPSTHGVIRLVLEIDGEFIRKVKPDVGFLHRGLEKIAESTPYLGFMPYTDRIDYVSSMICNQGYAMAVEKLAGIEVPERAEYIRVIAAELNRIASHHIALGSLAMDLGAITPFPYLLREREQVLDLFEILCGARLTYNFVRFGGVAFDLTDRFIQKTREFLESHLRITSELDRLISNNQILLKRLENVGVISAEDAIAHGLVGPNLRACGFSYDVRKADPYSIYPKVDFEVPVGKRGDSLDRWIVRVAEIRQSLKIVKQCLDQIPAGEYQIKAKKLKVLEGESFSRVESSRGELNYYLISKGGETPFRLRIRTGSFTAMTLVEKIAKGMMIADIVAFFASLDVCAPEIDR